MCAGIIGKGIVMIKKNYQERRPNGSRYEGINCFFGKMFIFGKKILGGYRKAEPLILQIPLAFLFARKFVK
jgi:hypothetical protein